MCLCISLSLYVYIYIYTYIHIQYMRTVVEAPVPELSFDTNIDTAYVTNMSSDHRQLSHNVGWSVTHTCIQ